MLFSCWIIWISPSAAATYNLGSINAVCFGFPVRTLPMEESLELLPHKDGEEVKVRCSSTTTDYS